MTKLAIILILGFTIPSFAHTYGQNIISLNLRNVTLRDALKAIEKQGVYRFVYKYRLLSIPERISVTADNAPLAEVLTGMLRGTSLTYRKITDKLVVITDAASLNEADPSGIVIAGTVSDGEGKPIVGASVLEKGTNNGTVTAEKGNFSLMITGDNATLVISSVGYAPTEFTVKTGVTRIQVKLEPANTEMQQMIVIGYGSQRKADVTSSVATVKSENFVKGPVLDAGQLLQGKVAGLSITAPSGDPTAGTQILLRGSTTLLGANSDPLVLIDGVPGTLKTIAPEDIESIDVLKDGSAAAIYGVRGTNGVIIITTKRARGNFTSSVDYSGFVSTQVVAKKLEMLTADDYRKQIAAGQRDKSWDLGSSTDWYKEISQSPVSHVHNLTLRGGNSKTNYLASANYRNLEGIFKKSDNKTFTGRIDVNHSMLDDKLRINLSLLNQVNNFTQTADGGTFNGYTYRQALIRNPTSPVKDSAGNWFEQTGNFNYENPLSRIFESDGETRSVNSRMNAMLTYSPIRGLKLSSLFSYSRYNLNSGYAETKKHISNLRDNMNGYAAVGTSVSIDRLTELTAEYSTSFKEHRVSLLAGYGYQENESNNNFMRNYDFPTDIFGYNNIGLGDALKQGKATMFSGKSETNLISFFGRLTYNYADRYLLLASLRHEGASQLFGANNPWGTFAAISGGWRISKEGFMRNQQIFDDLKLRVGYGVTGNPPSTSFLSQALLGYGDYVFSNGQWVRTLAPATNPNPYIRWEEKHETNLGLDFTILKGRVSGNVDYYVRRIKGLLYDYQVPSPPNLFTITRANVGTMENKGLEVMLNIVPVQGKDFQWNTSFNFSTNSNRLISLSNDLYKSTNNYVTSGGTGEPIQTFTNIIYIGKKIGDFYGFKVVDIDDAGKWIYEGADGKNVKYADFGHNFEDKKVLGNGLPQYYAGWNNNFRYKKVDLSVTMRGAFKYQILNFQRMYLENPSIQNYNRLKSSEEKIYGKALLTAPLEYNSHYIENGDFWKVDNITLGYNFDHFSSGYIKGLRIYLTTLNTLTITGYKGIDPEVNRLGLSPGNDDRDKYPTTRTFTFGVNLNL